MQKMGLFAQIGNMIARPSKVFERIREKPLLLLPVLIALAGGVFSGLYGLKMTQGMTDVVPAQAKGIMQAMGPLNVVMGAISGAASLFLNGLVLWLLLKIWKGKGSYLQAVSVAGIGAYPLLMRDILRAFFADVQSLDAMVRQAAATTFADALLRTLGMIGIVFVVWTAILYVKGFSRVFEMGQKKAAMPVIVFFALVILVSAMSGYASGAALTQMPVNFGG